MTLAYGATQYGFKDQLLDVMREYEDEHGEPLIAEEHKFASGRVPGARELRGHR
jgi:hypothetical protein